jgi:hypothetical protein
LANPNAKKMTKKQRKAEISAGVVADDSCSEEEVGVERGMHGSIRKIL